MIFFASASEGVKTSESVSGSAGADWTVTLSAGGCEAVGGTTEEAAASDAAAGGVWTLEAKGSVATDSRWAVVAETMSTTCGISSEAAEIQSSSADAGKRTEQTARMDSNLQIMLLVCCWKQVGAGVADVEVESEG